MSLQVEKLEHNMAKLTIEVSAEEVEKALQAAYLKERSKISLPGFRKLIFFLLVYKQILYLSNELIS